jgi:hypothetical protein
LISGGKTQINLKCEEQGMNEYFYLYGQIQIDIVGIPRWWLEGGSRNHAS